MKDSRWFVPTDPDEKYATLKLVGYLNALEEKGQAVPLATTGYGPDLSQIAAEAEVDLARLSDRGSVLRWHLDEAIRERGLGWVGSKPTFRVVQGGLR